MSYRDPDQGSPSVTLQCDVPLLKEEMKSWKNVSYNITWYSEGKPLFTDNICGVLRPGAKEYDDPCPGNALFSRLDGSKYSLHQHVSVCGLIKQ